jgi:hypothetical protein
MYQFDFTNAVDLFASIAFDKSAMAVQTPKAYQQLKKLQIGSRVSA